jgi:hypothetical protein
LEYYGLWTFFFEIYESSGPLLLRNVVLDKGEVREVLLVSHRAFEFSEIPAVCVSRNVTQLRSQCLEQCYPLYTVVFECGSHLPEIGEFAFSDCLAFRSIVIPSSVVILGPACFSQCRFLQSVVFEPQSKLAVIEGGVFGGCSLLHRVCLPASLSSIRERAFQGCHITSLEIEEGSVSFRVRDGLLLDFEERSLIWVIAHPPSVLIRSAIEELGPFCCAMKIGLRAVEFESDSNLRCIGRFAFADCRFESIRIPSSVEVLQEGCFALCWSLQTMTFGPESRLRVIERQALPDCGWLQLVAVPASVEYVGRGESPAPSC